MIMSARNPVDDELHVVDVVGEEPATRRLADSLDLRRGDDDGLASVARSTRRLSRNIGRPPSAEDARDRFMSLRMSMSRDIESLVTTTA